MEPKVADTLAKDVNSALTQYLNMSESLPEKKKQELLEKLLKKIQAEKTSTGPHEHDPGKQISLAIQTCALHPTKAAQLKSLHLAEIANRNAETLELCPTMCIQFQDRSWSEYYQGKSNIKYPDVIGMTPKVCTDSLIQKLMLFDLLQGDRQQCCAFALPKLASLGSDFPELPAIIIPSGGKNGKWLGTALGAPEKFWWVRFLKKVDIFFVVSDEELANYDQFKAHGVTVVGYDGFGMGCGRAAGLHVAKTLDRTCFMTDDRTKDLMYHGTSITVDTMKEIAPTIEAKYPWIMGVLPKGELNILTIINPKSTEPERPVFSRCFIASKEDKALFLYCEALRLRGSATNVGKTIRAFEVKFDADNPPCTNKDAPYEGKKGAGMKAVTDCTLYRSLDNVPLDWLYLSKNKEFLNRWDAVKMQDSAMFKLLESILEALEDPEARTKEFWQAFDKYLAPWFS
jgi:hypothetical protein